MKRILAILALLGSLCGASAQITHTSQGTVDQNADRILKKAAQTLNAGGVSFKVTLTSKDSNKKVISRHTADVLYSKGKYRVTFDDNVIYCDGQSTWHWNKEAGEVTVNTMTNAEDDLMNPAGIINNYNKNFKAKFIRQEENGDAVIDLTPKAAKSYYKIRLVANANSGRLRRMEMHNYDSSSAEYLISDYNDKAKITTGSFSFSTTDNPNVEIIDMR